MSHIIAFFLIQHRTGQAGGAYSCILGRDTIPFMLERQGTTMRLDDTLLNIRRADSEEFTKNEVRKEKGG
jgi:hypothetical protein